MEPEMSQENALRQISGIGPEIARALQQAGITLETLTEASVADILEALQERNITVSEADVHGWRVLFRAHGEGLAFPRQQRAAVHGAHDRASQAAIEAGYREGPAARITIERVE